VAYCWQSARDFPSSVRAAFKQSPDPLFHGIKPLLAIPERPVPLPGRGKASFSDLFVLAKSGADLVSITVEGKVSESFDVPVSEWLYRDSGPEKDASEATVDENYLTPGEAAAAPPTGAGPSAGKLERLRYLCQMLGLDESNIGA
jgi:hypothetical protein